MYYLLRPIVVREGSVSPSVANGKNALFCFPQIRDFQCMPESWEFNPVVERERPYQCRVAACPTVSAICMAIVESSLLTIRTLVTERAASRGQDRAWMTGVGSVSARNLHLGFLTFMAYYYLGHVCGSEASNSFWHLRCCSDWTRDILLGPSLHNPMET
jgi:hypothetical protein